MIDVELIRNEPDRIRRGLKNKQADPALVDRFLAQDGEWREGVKKLDELRHEQKKLGEERKIEEAKALKGAIKKLEERLLKAETKRTAVLYEIPNMPDEDVPVGKDESGNRVLRRVGEPPEFSFAPKDHVELGKLHDLIDNELGARVAGARFTYLKRDLVLLQQAIIQYAFSVLASRSVLENIVAANKLDVPATPFIPVVPPLMIKPDVMQRMARLEPKEERYHIESDDLYLIGSAEHTLGPMHMDETLDEADLPIRYAACTPAFRREAGSYGKDTRGILRLHQFDKIEMESFSLPERSRAEQDFFVAIQEHLLQTLEIPYQVVLMCTGDMGGPDARQIDIESWMPGQGKYRETHTSDLMTDYQARRLNTRVRRSGSGSEFVHTNDATAIALGRILIAIMENYQTKEGTIKIPKALQVYIGKKEIRRKHGAE